MLVAVGVGIAVLAGDRASDDRRGDREPAGGSAAATGAVQPVAVASDAPRHEDLAALVAASDLVVEAEVVSSVEGRWFGTAGSGRGATDGPDAGPDAGQAILSRFVTLRVQRVLAGPDPGADQVLVEEEGWTADGAPLVVDGLSAAELGDRGVWFLVEGGDAEVGAFVLVGAQGRYLERGGRLVGAAGDDPLVAELSSLTPTALAESVVAADG